MQYLSQPCRAVSHDSHTVQKPDDSELLSIRHRRYYSCGLISQIWQSLGIRAERLLYSAVSMGRRNTRSNPSILVFGPEAASGLLEIQPHPRSDTPHDPQFCLLQPPPGERPQLGHLNTKMINHRITSAPTRETLNQIDRLIPRNV